MATITIPKRDLREISTPNLLQVVGFDQIQLKVLYINFGKSDSSFLYPALQSESNSEFILADNYTQAARLIKHTSFDLIVINLKSPNLKTFNFLADVRIDIQSKAIPVIGVYPRKLLKDSGDIIEIEFGDVVLKPVCIDSWIHSAKRIL